MLCGCLQAAVRQGPRPWSEAQGGRKYPTAVMRLPCGAVMGQASWERASLWLSSQCLSLGLSPLGSLQGLLVPLPTLGL